MSLPWDRFPAEEQQQPPTPPPVYEQPSPPPDYKPPEPPPNYVPPEHLPERPGEVDFGKILKEAFSDALVEAGAKLKETSKGYAKDSWGAIKEGETVDVLHPTVTATTSKGQELVVADAKSRSGRTFVQGLLIDITFAVIAVMVGLSSDFDPMQKGAWIVLAALVIKTIIQTIVSYVMRLKVTPTIKTPGEKMALMPVPRPMMEEDKLA
jgi:hypothetical protein